jgi:hypothetical protein
LQQSVLPFHLYSNEFSEGKEMSDKIGIIQQTSMGGLNANNSGIGMTQLPPGHTKISGNSAVAAIGVAMVAGVPGQFPQSTKMSIQDGFGKVLEIKR